MEYGVVVEIQQQSAAAPRVILRSPLKVLCVCGVYVCVCVCVHVCARVWACVCVYVYYAIVY